MKIVFLSPAAERGGAEEVLLSMVEALSQRPAWQLSVIAGENGPLVGKVIALGVHCEVLPFPEILRRLGERSDKRRIRRFWHLLLGFTAGLSYRRILRARLRQLEPEIVHSNGIKMHLLSALALGLTMRPRLIWHIHDYLSTRVLMSRALRFLVNRCRLVIANSHSVAEDARQMFSSTVPVETVYNVVDPIRFSPDGPRLDLDGLARLPPPPQGTVRVGLAATFAHWKGHETFLRSIQILSEDQRCGETAFYVIGGPVYATEGSQFQIEELRGMAKALGIGDLVRFTGFIEDMPGAFRALDVVVHASDRPEPFGLVLVQAMACGRAVISTGSGGASELIRPEVDALTFPAADGKALAEAIDRFVRNPELRRRLGYAGRTKIQEQFAPERMVRNLTVCYERAWIA